MEDPIVAFLVLVYGLFVAYVQERFGKFQDLNSNQKQLVTALTGFCVPLAVNVVRFLFGEWPVELGSPEGLAGAVLMLLAPIAVWLWAQIAHQLDRLLQKAGTV